MLRLGLIQCPWTEKGAFKYIMLIKHCIAVIDCLKHLWKVSKYPAQHPPQYLGFYCRGRSDDLCGCFWASMRRPLLLSLIPLL